MEEIRLQKIIADRGYCSRRKAEELILAGKVFVDGKIIKELGSKFSSDVKITIDGVNIGENNKKEFTYLLLNKPLGVVTTLSDDRNRKTVGDLIPNKYERLFPVGRLDINTSGLIILTDDGEFANLVMHPSSQLEKTYLAVVEGPVRSFTIKHLQEGVLLEDGLTAPAKAVLKEVTDKTSVVELTIHEGKKREVRRMLEALGHKVIKLTRIAIGPIKLNQKVGELKKANPKDIEAIRKTCLQNKKNNKYIRSK